MSDFASLRVILNNLAIIHCNPLTFYLNIKYCKLPNFCQLNEFSNNWNFISHKSCIREITNWKIGGRKASAVFLIGFRAFGGNLRSML